mmetsp:Transcript_109492/g.194093  ORF Transcript_109492/g.194093 Transcript_109492/m.194093 type:complete len:1118 (+) Transcript_109492:86-3439(+)
MAPKKGRVESPVPDLAAISDAIPEEEEEGPGRVKFSFYVSAVNNLPCELETMVTLSGPLREKRSTPTPASAAPSEFEFEKSHSIRTVEQALFDDIAGKPMTISLLDAGPEAGFALIGKTELDFVPFLHEQTEIGGELKLPLTEQYHAKWFPEPDPAADDAESPAPAPTERPDVPATTITIRFEIPEVIAPPEDRDAWMILTMSLKGLFALPPRMTECGNAGAEDIELHVMKYQVVWFGEKLDVALTAPPEKKPEPAAPEAGAEPPAEPTEEELSEDEWRAEKERFDYSIRFKDEHIKRYRGSKFISDFRNMLNHVGGTWLYFTLEEKPSTDPKKPNPPEVGALVKHYFGKVWCNLTDLINPGTRRVEVLAPLLSRDHPEKDYKLEEPTLESSRSYARLALELSCDAAPPKPPHTQVPVSHLVPPHEDINSFPSSGVAANGYIEAVQRAFESVCGGCAGKAAVGQGGVPGLVELLKQSGTYGDTKQDLRNAIVCVFRERLRKDTGAVPGRPLTGAARDQFFSDAYAYLKGTMVEVLDDFRKNTPMPEGQADAAAPDSAEIAAAAATAEGASSPGHPGSPGQVGSDGGGEAPDVAAEDPLAAALAETEAARHSREALSVAAEAGERCARLAYEAEMVGNWDRAARLFQNRLLLEGCRRSPKVWIDYAKFCMRARGRQSSAEEALRQAVTLLAEGEEATPETNLEVDLMLACLLLDRGRYDEAIKCFRVRHEEDFGNTLFHFLLGLSYYLTGEPQALWKPMLTAVSKPRDWFEGLPNSEAVADKLRVFRDSKLDPAPYAACLEMLLDFGLPSLVFTFLDQCGILPKDLLNSEPIALIDAKASALDHDYSTALTRLEPLLANRAASQEAWRLAGECHFQMQNFEQALQDFQHALFQFEKKFEDPAVYIRWGHVLLLKKRWKQAREAFLRSIQYRPTAEAWSCVGHAEYRSEDRYRECYEALREANLLDNERSDVWAQLCLIHLRFENEALAEHCFRQCVKYSPESDELILEVAQECTRRDMLPAIAEAASRLALQLRDSWQGHAALADAFAKRGEAEKGILEAQIAIRLAPDQPDQRKAIFERALKWAEDMGDPALSESLHAVQSLADQQATELQRPDSAA